MSTATASKPIMSNKDILTDSVIFVSLNYRANPKKKGQHYPPFEIVPTMDEIYEVEESDGGNKQNERTRLIRYAPGIPSIYAPDDYDVSTHKAPPILLQDGYLAVSRKEVKLIEYLTKSNYNLNNINRMPNTYPIFKIRDEAQTASDFIQQEMEEVNLKMIVKTIIERQTSHPGFNRQLPIHPEVEIEEMKGKTFITGPKNFGLKGFKAFINDIQDEKTVRGMLQA